MKELIQKKKNLFAINIHKNFPQNQGIFREMQRKI